MKSTVTRVCGVCCRNRVGGVLCMCGWPGRSTTTSKSNSRRLPLDLGLPPSQLISQVILWEGTHWGATLWEETRWRGTLSATVTIFYLVQHCHALRTSRQLAQLLCLVCCCRSFWYRFKTFAKSNTCVLGEVKDRLKSFAIKCPPQDFITVFFIKWAQMFPSQIWIFGLCWCLVQGENYQLFQHPVTVEPLRHFLTTVPPSSHQVL